MRAAAAFAVSRGAQEPPSPRFQATLRDECVPSEFRQCVPDGRFPVGQRRKQPVPHPRAPVAEISIRGILQPLPSFSTEVVPQLLAAEAEQGAHEHPATNGDAGETAIAGATQEVQQEGLHMVIALMGERDPIRPDLAPRFLQEGVPGRAPDPVAAPESGDTIHDQRHTDLAAVFGCPLGPRRAPGLESVVEVSGGKLQRPGRAEGAQEMKQRDGIGSAGKSHEHGGVPWQQPGSGVEHAREARLPESPRSWQRARADRQESPCRGRSRQAAGPRRKSSSSATDTPNCGFAGNCPNAMSGGESSERSPEGAPDRPSLRPWSQTRSRPVTYA